MKSKTNHIIEIATTLFKQQGLHAVSMDDIASYSGISKRTLYENFESKETIISTIVQKVISNSSTYIRLCPDISPNAVKEMENFAEHLLGVQAIVTPDFIRDLKKYYPDTYTLLIEFRNIAIIPYLERCFKRGITEEHFRPAIMNRETGWFYCWQLQNAWEGDTSPTQASKIMESANDLFLHGILNPKGLKLLGINIKIENTGQNEKVGAG